MSIGQKMYITKALDIEYVEYRRRFYLDKRIDDLITCHNMGIKNVLYVVRNNYNQSIRYRVEHMIQAIDESENWNALMVESACLSLIIPYLDMIDVIIFHRTFYRETDFFIKECQAKDKHMFFDIDDYCFHEMCIEAAVASKKITREARKKMIDEYRKVYCECEGIIVSTPFLKNEIRKIYNGKIYLYHNFMNKEESELAEEYWNQKVNGCYEDSRFEIGYFSGSNGHDYDFALIRNALYTFMSNHGDVYLVVVGEVELPREFEHFKDRIERLPFMTGCQLLNQISRVDLNVVPLEKNNFNEARSEIKYFDAATVGTPSCFSNVSIYRDLLSSNDEMNHLCENKDWLVAFEDVYEQRKKGLKRFESSREKAYEEYKFTNQIAKLGKILDKMVNNK